MASMHAFAMTQNRQLHFNVEYTCDSACLLNYSIIIIIIDCIIFCYSDFGVYGPTVPIYCACAR